MATEGTPRLNRGLTNPFDFFTPNEIIQIGEVASVDDPQGLGRIRIRAKGPASRGGDDFITNNDELRWGIPMVSNILHVKPKVGEIVFYFSLQQDKQHVDALYFGPIISTPDKLNKDEGRISALRALTISNQNPNVNIDNIPKLKGIFPNREDISLQGRYNTDITQKKNEIVIRAGKFIETNTDANNPYPFEFNSKTQAYIQIKNDVVIKEKTNNNNEEKGTITNIVSNKINLLTHSNSSKSFNLTNQDNLISDDEMLRILKTAHPLPYGDLLLEYLKLMKDAILNHVHNGNGNSATDLATSGNKLSVFTFKSKAEDLERRMLSTNIRIS